MNLTGHIRSRTNKKGTTYQLVIEFPAVDGGRKRKYKTLATGTTKKAAQKKLREYILAYEESGYVESRNISVAKWMEEFQQLYMKNSGLSPTTIVSYQDAIRGYINPVLGEVMLQKLKPMQIQKWVNEIADKSPASGKPLAPKTVINKYQCLKKALDVAVNMGLLKENPALKVTLPKRKKFRCEIYDEVQIRQLIQSVKGTDLELPVELEIAVGLRRGELLGLTFHHLDFEKNTLTVAKNIVSVNGSNHEKDPKTEAGNRTIPVSKELMQKLARQHIRYKENKLQYGKEFEDTDLVFCKKNGKAYNADYFSEKFRRHLKKHELPHMRFHDLRHLCASIYLDNSVSPKVISQILGHSDISTTLSIYSHVMERSSQEAVDKMANYLYGSG